MNVAANLLLDVGLRGGLLGLGTLLAHRVLRRHLSAAVCHRLLACAIAALALMPVVMVCCDGWAVLPRLPQAVAPVQLHTTHVPVVVASKSVSAPITATPPAEATHESHSSTIKRTESTITIPSAPASPAAMATAKTPSTQWHSWRVWLVTIWGMGAVAIIMVLGHEMLRLHRLRSAALPLRSDALLAEAIRCALSIGLRRVPDVCLMQKDDGPLVIGFWRPAVMLPDAFQSWPAERRRAVLLHEMAHVLRRDGLVQLLAALVCALHWLNPLALLLLKRLRHEAECACDDVVLGARMTAACYADHLLAVASGGRSASMLAPSMAQVSGLRRRVQSVLSTTMRRGAVGRLAGLVILVAAVALSLPVMLAQSAESKPAPDDKKPANAVAKKTPAPTKVAVSLQTVDTKDEALRGVSLRVFRLDKKGPLDAFTPDFTGITDERGRWQAELPLGDFMVLAERGRLVAPYRPDAQTRWYLRKNQLKRDLKLKLVEGGDVQVTVLEAATRKPVPKAKVIMDCGHCAMADDSGKVRFTAVPLGEHSLKALSPGFADADKIVAFNSTGQPSSTVEVLLEPGFEVRGRVTNSEGVAVKGVVVSCWISGDYLLVGTNRAVTDAEGNYALGWYSRYRPLWSLTAEHKDYANLTRRNVPPPDDGTVLHQDFVMDEGRQIAGVVKDEGGQPIKGASVRYGGSWATGDLRWTRTDAEGKFKITKIGPDEERAIVVEAKDYAATWQKAIPGKGESVPQLEFVMKKGFTASVRLVDRDGKGVPRIDIGPRVMIDRWPEFVDGSIDGDIFSDAEGYFRITSLPETGAFFNGSAPGVISQISDYPLDVTQPVVVVVDKPGVIKGRVVEAGTRKPVKKFNVRLGWPRAAKDPSEPKGGFSAHLSSRGQEVQSDDGTFLIDGLITRMGLAVTITSEGFAKSYTDKVIVRPADDAEWPREFVLESGRVVLGHLTDAVTGKSVSGAKIFFVAKEHWYSSVVYAQHLADLRGYGVYDDVNVVNSNASGVVEFSLPHDATFYTAVIAAPGYATVLLDRQSASDPSLRVRPLVRAASVRGTVAGLAGVDLKEDYISVDTPNVNVEARLRADGSFEATGLPPGTAVVVARNGHGIYKGSAMVELKAGESLPIDFARLSPASVKVIATRGGVPLKDAEVTLTVDRWANKAMGSVGRGETDEKGVLTMQHLPAVKATIRCYEEGRRGAPQQQPIDLSDPGHPPEIRFEFPEKDLPKK